MVSPLVSSTWLRQQLVNGLKHIRLLDATWHLDKSRNAHQEYLKERIDGAVFFDIDEVCDKSSPFSHMLPSPEQFSEQVGQLGVANNHHVIVYDNSDKGFFSSPRVWWMFRVFGHSDISVLDGGLQRWKFREYPVYHGPPPTITPQEYNAKFDDRLVRTFEQMVENFNSKKEQVVDARSKGRFLGTDSEPRPSLPSGHIIGAKNIPYTEVINPETKILKSKHELQEVFEQAGIDLEQPVVASCGSGVTASVLAFAAYILHKDVPVYDGSWTEWAQSAPPHTMNTGSKGETQ